MPRKIIASATHSPLPTRQHDWCAFYDGEEEAGNYGYGATEAEAVQDFIDNCQEAHDERLTLRFGWKCNNCTTVFTAAQTERSGGQHDGGPACPHCKAGGQFTYPHELHKGDPCERCGIAHDDVQAGPCAPSYASSQAEIARLREALQGAIGALEFSRDYHADLGNEEQAFAQDKLDAARAALEPKP